jgi:anti-sigma factor RsiW
MTLSCWFIRRRLGAYQDGELAPPVRERVAGHVRGCESCRRELETLRQLRSVLTLEAPELPDAVWTAFWPQVRARIAAPEPAAAPAWERVWGAVKARPRLALAPALAAGALAVLTVVAPWQPRGAHEPLTPPAPTGSSETAHLQSAALDQVVIQSIETEDPDAPVMVYASPESDVTVLWVFGLARTGT